jgi:hypothetical protein
MAGIEKKDMERKDPGPLVLYMKRRGLGSKRLPQVSVKSGVVFLNKTRK